MNSSSGLSIASRTKTNQNVQVYVRVRPLNTRERLIRSHEVVEVSSSKEIISRQMPESKVTKKFTFDRTFGPDSTQVEVYQCVVAPLIEEVIAGYNCTVFAYGQTGTGKTHTMVGEECPNLRSSWEDQTSVGIIPRALSHLFDELRLMEVEFSMRISYLEIYNEELCDLLSTDDSTQIRIFDNAQKKGTVIIQGLEEVPVHSKEDVYKLLEKGQDRRKTATTLMNAQSSRSHTVFSILVHIKENGIEGEEMLKIGKLNLVDLAGSENISKAGNEKGIRTRETVNINQSLLTLGRCITALVERTPHIPYRESKLTRLLQESLGGRTKTSIIATISPGHKDLEETLSTLEYAHRAKHIQNKPELNQKLTKKVVIKEYSEEIERLRKELVACREKNGIYLPDDTFNELQYKLDSQNRELNEKILLLKALKDDLASKERLFNEVSLNLVEKTEELKKKDKHLLETKTELDKTKKVLTTTKKRYKEKKFLLQNHVKTEQELFDQAKKLVEVADVATTDTVQLHDTIYRRKMVDTKIRTACEKFVSKMQGNFGQMKNNLNDFEDKHEKCSKVMHEQMSKYMQDYKRFTNELVGKLILISTLQKDSTKIVQLFESLVKNVSHIKDGSIEEVRTLVNNIQQEQAQREKECQEYIEGLLDLIQKGQHDWTSNNSKLLDVIEENKSLTSTFISENSMLIENNTKRHENELKLEINTLISTFTEQEKISQSRQNVIDNMKKEFEKFYTTMQSLEAEEQMSRVNLVNISKNLETSNSVTAKNFHNVKENLESFALTNDQMNEELRTKVQDANDELSSLLDVETTKINEFNETVTKDRRKYANDMSSLQILDECNINKLNAKVESIEEEIRNTHGYFCEQVNNACKESECLIRLDNEAVSNHYTQVSALGSSLLGNLVDYKINCEAVVDECKRNIEEFHRNEFKPYTPTGQTPVKREFSYPRTLAATASHNSLLHRFRTEQDWSDLDTTTSSITEDCEPTLNDLSNDKVMLYSTPKYKSEELKVLKTSSSSVVTSFSEENFNSSQKNSSASILSVKEEDKENVF